jgi:hypothetical protein
MNYRYRILSDFLPMPRINLHDLQWRMIALEQQLRPIAQRSIDINKPGWEDELKNRPNPLEEAGVRSESEALLAELVACYAAGTEPERQSIRRFFDDCRSFSWVAALPFDPDTTENFRQHLILFSMQDQGRDSRDAILSLQSLCQMAKKARVNRIEPLREVAALSSETDKFGMGSTRAMLLQFCNEK